MAGLCFVAGVSRPGQQLGVPTPTPLSSELPPWRGQGWGGRRLCPGSALLPAPTPTPTGPHPAPRCRSGWVAVGVTQSSPQPHPDLLLGGGSPEVLQRPQRTQQDPGWACPSDALLPTFRKVLCRGYPHLWGPAGGLSSLPLTGGPRPPPSPMRPAGVSLLPPGQRAEGRHRAPLSLPAGSAESVSSEPQGPPALRTRSHGQPRTGRSPAPCRPPRFPQPGP